MNTYKISFKIHGKEQGSLISVEENKDVPFQIKRVYYVYGTPNGVTRGRHAHKSLEQVIICVHGSCRIKLDNGREQEIITLNRPDEGLYISHAIWREMFDFSPETVLMVLASQLYAEDDYIRDYEKFREFVKIAHES